MGQIEGVEMSFANESGTLVRTSLRPGADPEKVAREVQRILSEEAESPDTPRTTVEAGSPLSLRGGTAATALREEQWRDSSQVARQAAERDGPKRRSFLLLALLLACVGLGLALLWWRRLPDSVH